MRLSRPLTLLLCAMIVVGAWAGALLFGRDLLTVATAWAVTLLCLAVLMHYVRLSPGSGGAYVPRRLIPRDESAEFRRSVFNLCAALKLGIRSCEDHLDADPELLLRRLQQMEDHIHSFINEMTRPVQFKRGEKWSRRLILSRWPWRPNAADSPRRN